MKFMHLMPVPLGTAVVVAATALTGFSGGLAAQPTLDSLYQAAQAAGEKEVVIYGPPEVRVRMELSKAFNGRFPDIALAYTGLRSNQVFSKVSSESKAGVQSADVVISGTTTITHNLKSINYVQPMDKVIVLPDVLDGKHWLGGKIAYGDDERTMLAMTATITLANVVNNTLVKPGQVLSDADMRDPRWKGKIISGDPTRPGPAHFHFRRLYDLHGEDWVRRFIVDQEIVFASDARQIVDAVAKGRYAIGMGVDITLVNEFISKGVTTLEIEQNGRWRDKMLSSVGFGGLAVAAKPGHPNAAKLFANWLLTREGQLALCSGLYYGSRRTDVVVPALPAVMTPKDGVDYMEAYTHEFVTSPNTQKLMAMVKKIMAEK